MNALLDDASSVAYINEELAEVLGLSAEYEEVTANVLNDTVQTFDTMLVKMNLESCDETSQFLLKLSRVPGELLEVTKQ